MVVTLSRVLEIARSNRENGQSGEFDGDGCSLESFADNAHDTVIEEGGCDAQARFARALTLNPERAKRLGFYRIVADSGARVVMVELFRGREITHSSKDGGSSWSSDGNRVLSGLANQSLGMWLEVTRNGRVRVSA